MSYSGTNTSPAIGLNVYAKENEDHALGVVKDIESGTGNLIVRGNTDLRIYSVPSNLVIRSSDPDRIILDMTRDDFIQYWRT